MSSRHLLRRVRSAALRVLVPVLTQTVGRLPYPGLELFARGLARVLLVTNRRDREHAGKHLRLAFPEVSEDELRDLVRECFLNASLNAVEILQLLARGPLALDRRLVIEGWEHLERHRGRRVLLLCCHSGFWELIGIATLRHKLPTYAITRRPDDPVFAALVSRFRALMGPDIERGTAEGRRRLRRALKGEGALAIFIDQDTTVDGTWVPFFGRLAYTPVGAAEMALRHRMAVVPAFFERRPGGVHVARFLPELELPDDVNAATAAMSATIEAHIRRHPAQWVWWHRRWRRQPGDGQDGPAPRV